MEELVAANQPLTAAPKAGSRFARRLELLRGLDQGKLILLLSRRLIGEYEKEVSEPRNDYVRVFFELCTDPGRHMMNYAPWGQMKQKARRCRFPNEDRHVLRTAKRDHPTTLYAEEGRILSAAKCIYRELRVTISEP